MGNVYARHAVNLDASAYGTYLRSWRTGELITGESTAPFEKGLARFLGAGNCVAAGSARAAFYLALRALEISPGDEVIMPAYTFPSMPAVVVAAGARPVFVDVDPETFLLAPEKAAAAANEKTAAIVVAHLFGRAAEMRPFEELAEKHSARLIEDCAHSLGAMDGGRRVGSIGDVGLFSFGIGKNMPCFGGGAAAFRDREVAGRFRKLITGTPPPADLDMHLKILSSFPSWLLTRRRVFPWTLYIAARILDSLGSDAMDRFVEEPLEETTTFSLRSLGRMANVQAAVGERQLELLPARNRALAATGQRLAEKLADVPGVTAAPSLGALRHIYLYFRILVPEAPRFRSLLLRRGVDTQRDDMADCSSLEAFSKYAADCPAAASLPARSIEIPNNPDLEEEDLDYIARAVREVAEIISEEPRAGAAE